MGAGSGQSHCADICSVAASLSCPGDGSEALCVTQCETAYTQIPDCHAEVQAYYDCGYAVPASEWECDDMDEAAPKAGHCETESDALNSCLDAFLNKQ